MSRRGTEVSHEQPGGTRQVAHERPEGSTQHQQDTSNKGPAATSRSTLTAPYQHKRAVLARSVHQKTLEALVYPPHRHPLVYHSHEVQEQARGQHQLSQKYTDSCPSSTSKQF